MTDSDGEPGGDGGDGCPKCGRRKACAGGIPAPMSGPELLAGATGEQFTVVKCTFCGYSEFYGARAEDHCLEVFYEADPEDPAERATLRPSGDLYHCSRCGEVVEERTLTCPGCNRVFEDR